MNVLSSILSIFLLGLILASCNPMSLNTYDRKVQKKIRSIKRNKKYTYLERANHRFKSLEEVRKYHEQIKTYKFKKSRFDTEEIIFVLRGINTLNFGVLNKIVEISNLLPIDSSACSANEFLYLKLDPIESGEYQIISSGCRHYEEYKIVIE